MMPAENYLFTSKHITPTFDQSQITSINRIQNLTVNKKSAMHHENECYTELKLLAPSDSEAFFIQTPIQITNEKSIFN